MKATAKTLRLVAAIALAFAAMTATAAKKLDVRITATSGSGKYGYWVEYTINGVKYRSDQALERVNQIAWSGMSHDDRLKVIENVYSVGDARNVQFGKAFASNMTYWYNQVKGWNEAKEILEDRLVEKDYPGLVERFGEGFQEYCDKNFRAEHEGEASRFPELNRLCAEKALVLVWASDAYFALRKAEYVRTAAAVKSTSGDLIQLICDKCLVPSITLTSAGGIGILSASDSWLGISLDYANSLLHIQDNLTEYLVGERATAKAAARVIENATTAIQLDYKIIQDCTKRAHELAAEIDTRFEQLQAESDARLAKLREEDNAYSGQLDAIVGTEEKTASIVSRLNELQRVIDNAATNYNNALVAYQNAVGEYIETRERDAEARMESARKNMNEKEQAWEDAKYAKEKYRQDTKDGVWQRFNAWITKWKGIHEDFCKEGDALGEVSPELSIDTYKLDIILADAYSFNKVEPDEVDGMIAAIEKWLSQKKDFDKKCDDLEARFKEQRIVCYTEWKQMAMDMNAIGSYLSTPREIEIMVSSPVPAGKDAPWVGTKIGSTDNYAAWLEVLKKWSAARQAVTASESAFENYTESVVSKTKAAISEFKEATAALEGFELPGFVTEQKIQSGVLVLDEGTELGRQFLSEDAAGTAETAAGYRTRLNDLVSAYDGQLAACYDAKEKAHVYARLLSSSLVWRHAKSTSQSYSAVVGDFERSGNNNIRQSLHVHKLRALHRDFNNRSQAHEELVSIYGSLNERYDEFVTNIVGHYATTYTAADQRQEANDPYLCCSVGARYYGSEPLHWSNPSWVLWPGTGLDFVSVKMTYNRGLGSYAYYAKDYYKKYFGNEPDPYEDLVKPLVAEMDAARAAYDAAYILPFKEYTVTFERNGGGGADMEPQVFMHGVPQALNANIWSPPFPGDKFVGWATYWDEPIIYTNCQVITVTHDMTLYARWSGEYGGGEGGGEVYDPSEMPTLFVAGTAETAFTGDATYNGWVRNADGSLAGQLTVKAGKPAKPEKGGQSKLTITYTPFGGKKQTIKLANDAMPVAGGVATVAIPGVGTVKFTGDALVGVGVDVQAGKDMLKSRDRGEKAAATAAAASKAGVWTFALGTDAGFAAFSVTVDKKGKGKLAGTFPDGTKVSVSAQGVLGDGVLAIPFTYAKKGTLGFVFWVKGDGTAVLSDLTGDVGGSPGTARPTMVAPSASHRLADGEHVFTADDVSQVFTVAGKKWNVPKQNKRAEVDPNPTGLKLAFTEKTGAVKGTFTVVDGKAKTKYTVVGAVVGGKFYGTAYARNAGSASATAE